MPWRLISDWHRQSKTISIGLFGKILDYDIDGVRTMLLQGSNVNEKDPCIDSTPLHIAAENSLLHFSDKLKIELTELGSSVECPDVSKILEIAETWVRHQADIVELLLQHGADVNVKNQDECTPLHMATIVDLFPVTQDLYVNWPDIEWEKKFQNCILKVINETCIRKVELLLSKGADVNIADKKGQTPLHLAVIFDSPSIVKLLLDHGAHVNATTIGGETPLYYAVRLDPGIVELLLGHGAEVNVRGRCGATALHRAVVNGSASTVKMLLELGADVNARNLRERTALLLLTYETSPVIFRSNLNLLLQYGADLEARDDEGLTLAHMMCKLYFAQLYEPEKCGDLLSIINEAFSHGLDVNAKDQLDHTPYTHMIQSIRRDITSRDSNEFQYSIFVNHIRKLVTLGAIHMAKKNRSLFSDIMNLSLRYQTNLVQKSQLVPMEIEKDDCDYYGKCVQEAEDLRNIQISQNITLADILIIGDPVTLASISQNIFFLDYAQSVDLDSRFPIYASIITHQYERGLEMKQLCEKCEISLGIVSRGKLNEDCAQEVLQYLSGVELKNLSKIANQ